MDSSELSRLRNNLTAVGDARAQLKKSSDLLRATTGVGDLANSITRQNSLTTATRMQKLSKTVSSQMSPTLKSDVPSTLASSARAFKMAGQINGPQLNATHNVLKGSTSAMRAAKMMSSGFDTSSLTNLSNTLETLNKSHAFNYSLPEAAFEPTLSFPEVDIEPSLATSERQIELSGEDLRYLMQEAGEILVCSECGRQDLAENADHAGGTGRAGQEYVCRSCRSIDPAFR